VMWDIIGVRKVLAKKLIWMNLRNQLKGDSLTNRLVNVMNLASIQFLKAIEKFQEINVFKE